MKYPRFLLVCLGLLAALWTGAVQALPTVDQVQAAAQRGDYAGAEKMMREVVAAKPDSARAHYVLAELLAHERQFNEAAEHTRRARSLDPALKFTDPAKFKAFEQLLQREQIAAAKPTAPTPLQATAPPPQQRAAPATAAESSSGGGVPVWMLVVGAIAFIAMAAAWMRRRAAAPAAPVAQPAMAGGYGMGGGYGPGMPQQGPMGGGGSGLMGVGLGVAGGVAAGMLAERLLNGGHDERGTAHQADAGAGAGAAGGLIPGSFGGDDSAATELTRRDIDFGSGDGWGGGDAGGGDFGGGGSDDW
jgi:hypothetical protein